MDHTKAVSEHSAERYLLGEMAAVEAEEFERHYFECRECALAVDAAQVFIANGREVLRESEPEANPKRAHDPPRLSLWDALFGRRQSPTSISSASPAFAFSLATAVMFGGLSLYQGAVQIPGLRQTLTAARVVPSFQLAPATRGDASRVTVPAGTSWFTVSGDIPPDAHFPKYVCDLSAGGRVLVSLPPAPPPAPGQPITIQLSSQGLPAGTYDLAIYGIDSGSGKRERVSVFTFTLEYP